MKIKQIVKIIIDIIMTVLFSMLVFGSGLGMFFHEVAGISVFVLFGIHLILNASWIKKSFVELFHGKITRKNCIFLMLDIIVFLGVVVIMATSLIISRVVFSFNVLTNISFAETAHNTASYITLGVLGIHMGLHLEYLVASIGKIIKDISLKAVRRTLASTAAIIAVCAIIYTQTYNAYEGGLSSQNVVLQETSGVMTGVTENTNEVVVSETATDENTTKETTTQKKKDEESSTEKQTTKVTTTQAAVKTLNEYLGNLHCNGCGKHCSLLAPQCGRGQSQVQSATQEYYNTYGTEN